MNGNDGFERITFGKNKVCILGRYVWVQLKKILDFSQGMYISFCENFLLTHWNNGAFDKLTYIADMKITHGR